jgi:dolichol-phosphate mannosyltransferase
MMDRCALSLIVPTRNERATLERLVSAVATEFASRGIDGELIVVDDNSPDGTGAIADQLALRYPVRVVHRARKLGLASAVLAGFERARGDVLGVMDADLSHPPSVVPGMLAAMRVLGADMVVASRYVPGGGVTRWPWRRRVMSRVASRLARPITPVRDATSGFFLVRRDAVEGVRLWSAGFKIGLELLGRGRIGSVAEFPYRFSDRAAGRSKMSAREVGAYLVQLLRLYRLRATGRHAPVPVYRQVTPAEARDWASPDPTRGA